MACQFLYLAGVRKLNDVAVMYRDAQYLAYTGQCGVMLYYLDSMVECIGDFDPVYGRGMFEYGDLTMRIHNAGMTSLSFADVIGKAYYSLGEYEQIERSVPPSRIKSMCFACLVKWSGTWGRLSTHHFCTFPSFHFSKKR